MPIYGGGASGSGTGVTVVRAASTVNTIVASGLINGTVFGGVTLVTGDKILLKDQTVATENGPYVVSASGAAARDASLLAGASADGTLIFVQQGTSAGQTFQQTANPAVVGTNNLQFDLLGKGQLAEKGTVYSSALVTITSFTIATSQIVTGLSFTAVTSGDYQIDVNIAGQYPGGTNARISFALFNSLTPAVQIANSERTVGFQDTTTGQSIQMGSLNDKFSLVAGQTYQIQVWNPNSTAGCTIPVNTVNQRSSFSWNKIVAQPSVAGTAGAIQGQIISADQTVDYGNWILLDGRLKSALTAAQQAVATALGYGANIPDMRGRFLIGSGTLGANTYAYQSTGGAAAIAQNQLPNVSPTATANVNYWAGNSGLVSSNTSASFAGLAWIAAGQGTVAYGGNAPGIGSINGGVTQQAYNPPYRASNWFVWLGPAASTVTTVQPLTLTTTGTGAATFTPGTGVLNIPAPPTLARFRANNSGVAVGANVTAGWTATYNVGGGTFLAGVYTVPRAGFYKVTQTGFMVSPGGIGRINILKNGATYLTGVTVTSGGLGAGVTASDTVQCASGDTIGFGTANSSPTSMTGGTENSWTIEEQP
jgi:hypothetical protein